MRTRLFLANILFWTHALIVVFWIGLFLVPTSIWPDRFTFQFYLTLVIVGHQFIWGAMIMPWTHKFRMVCILTTPTQLLRGLKISDPKNYDHSWLNELVGKKGVGVSHAISTLITLSVLSLATFQYLFLR